MNTKHTPGPWRLEEWDEAHDVFTVATNDWEISTVSGIANAQLIATAPELLEALQLLTRKGWTIETRNIVAKAIAKATSL
jgi:hypothetical protein